MFGIDIQEFTREFEKNGYTKYEKPNKHTPFRKVYNAQNIIIEVVIIKVNAFDYNISTTIYIKSLENIRLKFEWLGNNAKEFIEHVECTAIGFSASLKFIKA